VLSTFGDSHLAFRKRGAPFTFDAPAFLSLVKALKSTPVTTDDELDLIVKAPSFDHAAQDPVNDDIEVPSTSRVVIIEGNYTLLDQDPWNEIASLVDERYGSQLLV
jgi:pantothenate kinase